MTALTATSESDGKRCRDTILATVVVPWDEQGRFLEEPFRQLTRTLVERLTPDLYVFGTGGEGYAVSDAQFGEVAAAFADEMQARGGQPMLGVISLSLATVIERIELGCELGYTSFQLSLPSWGPLGDDEVDAFFRETCARFPERRFLHYNVGRTKRILRGADYRRLAEAHPNLVALKFSSSDWRVVDELVGGAGDVRCFLTEHAFALARDRHDCGLLASIVALDLARAREFHEARGDRLRAMLAELEQLDRLLEECVEDPRVHMDGAFDKLIARVHAPGFPLRLLPPYRGAADEAFDRLLARLPPSWRS
jgi:dihydrodipicolinate synthase/N-acetylneuraminate lyase